MPRKGRSANPKRICRFYEVIPDFFDRTILCSYKIWDTLPCSIWKDCPGLVLRNSTNLSGQNSPSHVRLADRLRADFSNPKKDRLSYQLKERSNKKSGIRKIFLVCSAAALILIPSFCHAGTEAGDAYFKGIGLAAGGKLEEAKAEFQKSLVDDSVYPYARLELHAIDDVLNHKIKKETALLVFQGKELASQKKWQEAIDLFNKAIKENPNYGYAFISKGIAYMSQGELDKAISNFSESIDVSPEFTEAYQNRGVLYEYKGQFNKAIVDFDKAIAADPTSYILYFNRGMAHVYKNQCDKALPDLEKAIELKPNYAKAYINKGVVLEDLKRTEEAIEAYRKAMQLDTSQDKEIAKDAEASIRALEAEKKKADDSKKDK